MREEIGFWSTERGTVGASLDFESDDSGPNAQELPSWATGALKGAAAGATTGLAAGPYGALIGGVTGAIVGAATSGPSAPSAPAAPQKRPAPSPSPGPTRTAAPAPAGSAAAGANVGQALQQLAAIMPALLQLVASSGQAKRTESGGDVAGVELGQGAGDSQGPESWQESLEGIWTTP